MHEMLFFSLVPDHSLYRKPKGDSRFLDGFISRRRLDHAKWQNQMDERLIFLQMWVPYNSHFDL
jgi:hypothetical protein